MLMAMTVLMYFLKIHETLIGQLQFIKILDGLIKLNLFKIMLFKVLS